MAPVSDKKLISFEFITSRNETSATSATSTTSTSSQLGKRPTKLTFENNDNRSLTDEKMRETLPPEAQNMVNEGLRFKFYKRGKRAGFFKNRLVIRVFNKINLNQTSLTSILSPKYYNFITFF